MERKRSQTNINKEKHMNRYKRILSGIFFFSITTISIAQMTVSQHITKGRFAFVPQLNWNKKYSDNELYSKYELDIEEINFIEKTIMKME